MLPKRRKPTHPGVILEEDFLKPLNMTPKKLAETIGGEWNERKVQDIIDAKQNINEKSAEAFGAAFGVPANFWLKLQHQYCHFVEKHLQDEKGSLKPWKKAG